jgi:hypothetical protein
VGLFAKVAIRFGIKPKAFWMFSSTGFEASGAVAMVKGWNRVSVALALEI